MTSISSAPDAAATARAFHALFAEISACGATPGGGITRLCASAEDGQARRLFANSTREAGADILVDGVGNQFAIFPLADGPGAPLVMLGSHLDSQPKAGRFDGTYGVVAAAAIGAALMRARRAGETFGSDFCAVNWTGEEGARFRPSLLGSGAYAGARRIEEALSSRDDAGITLRGALDGIGFLGTDRPPPLPACYLELHVEQGLVLEKAKASIGIVTRNWGAAKIDVVFTGEQAHTGPTPMPRRRDALLADVAGERRHAGLAVGHQDGGVHERARRDVRVHRVGAQGVHDPVQGAGLAPGERGTAGDVGAEPLLQLRAGIGSPGRRAAHSVSPA